MLISNYFCSEIVQLYDIEEYLQETKQVNDSSTALCMVFICEGLYLAREISGSHGEYEHGNATHHPDHGSSKLL
jgi:hypothetical protein